MENKLKGKRVAILATNGFEQSELERPKSDLTKAGAQVDVISIKSGEIQGFDHQEKGRKVMVDATLDAVSSNDYDALVLPGGVINPDTLRTNDKAVKFVREFFKDGKPVGAICHAPWLLIDAGVVKGRTMTSVLSVRTDLRNAGANVVDKEVVVDKGLVTSRTPDDLDAFCSKLIEEIAEGKQTSRKAAA